MSSHFSSTTLARNFALAGLTCLLCLASSAGAQTFGRKPVHFRVDGPSQRLEMIVNTSRILTLDTKIPKAQVNNPEIVRLQPLSPNQIQIAAKKPGVTQVNLWDENDEIHTVDVLVYGDARELEMLLEAEFPDANLSIRPLASSVVLSGFVDRPEAVSRIITMAEDYYPKVINNISVGGVQQVQLNVKVMEVSRTKLRELGFDWAYLDNSTAVIQSVAGLVSGVPSLASGGGNESVFFGIMDNDSNFFGFIDALRQHQLVKLLAEPKLVTVSGRPASFKSGGEFPILVPQSLGTISIEYKTYGTQIDFVPIVLGNGHIRLEVRPKVSELDQANGVTFPGSDIVVPALRDRWADTAVEMRSGQTLALAGLLQRRTETVNRGLPWLADLPWAGAAFRRVEERTNEVELLILVTPELVGPMDPHEVPPRGPGQFTEAPNDVEFYLRGYLEVPKRYLNDGSPESFVPGGMESEAYPFSGGQVPQYDEIPSGVGIKAPVESPEIREPAGTDPAGAGAGDPSFRNNRSAEIRPVPKAATSSRPGLIGPIGYDVLH